jgi:hypothetical protein
MRSRSPWGQSVILFIAFWLAAAILCIGLPAYLTRGR